MSHALKFDGLVRSHSNHLEIDFDKSLFQRFGLDFDKSSGFGASFPGKITR